MKHHESQHLPEYEYADCNTINSKDELIKAFGGQCEDPRRVATKMLDAIKEVCSVNDIRTKQLFTPERVADFLKTSEEAMLVLRKMLSGSTMSWVIYWVNTTIWPAPPVSVLTQDTMSPDNQPQSSLGQNQKNPVNPVSHKEGPRSNYIDLVCYRDEKAIDIEKKAVGIQKKAVGIQKKAVGNKKKAVGIKKKAEGIEEKAPSIEEKAVKIHEKALDIQEKDIDMDHNVQRSPTCQIARASKARKRRFEKTIDLTGISNFDPGRDLKAPRLSLTDNDRKPVLQTQMPEFIPFSGPPLASQPIPDMTYASKIRLKHSLNQ